MTADWLSKMYDKKVILYVDYSRTFTDIIDNFNDNDDYIIATAFDADDAINKVKVLGDKVYLLIIDMSVSKPKISAPALYERYLRPILLKDNIPIIFQITKDLKKCHIFTYRIKRLINTGIADIIFKPYTKEQLLCTIKNLVNKFGDRILENNIEGK